MCCCMPGYGEFSRKKKQKMKQNKQKKTGHNAAPLKFMEVYT